MTPYVPGPVPADLATYLRLELEKVRASLDSAQAALDRALWLRDFEATGDGVADDTGAFEAVREHIIGTLGDGSQGPDSLVTLHLDGDRHYTYTNNRWTYGIPRLRIEGHGARLECTSSNASSANARALNQVSWFSDNGYALVPGGSAYKTFGHLISDSAAGQADIGFVTVADAANYAPGDTVLIGGLPNIAVDANPVDYRYFEVREVASVDTVAGTLTLTESLAYGYSSTWPVLHTENGYTLGPARVLKLNRAAHILTHEFEMNDVVLVANRNQPTLARAVFDSALRIRLNRVDTRDLILTSFSAAVSIECQSCRFGEVEGDKLVERVVLNDCEVTGDIVQFVGTQQIEINRGVLRGGAWKVAAKHQLVRGTYLDNMVYSAPGKVGLKLNYDEPRRIESQVFEDLRVSDPSLQLVDPAFTDIIFSATFSALGTNDELLIAKPVSQADWYTYNSIYAGARMVSADGAALCEVTGIADYDASNVAIEVSWLTAVPAAPVTLYHCTNLGFRVTGGNAKTAWSREDGAIRLRWTDRDPFWRAAAQDFPILGNVRSVRVDVLRASTYAGTHALWFRDVDRAVNLFEIDLKTAGVREMTPNAITGSAGADAFTAANWQFIETLRIEPRIGASGGLPAAASEQARLVVEAEIGAAI